LTQPTPADGTAPTGPQTSAPPDGALVRRVLGGEPAAFGALYERHVDRVYKFALFRVRDAATAADLTHDAFASALRALPSLREHDRFAAWLMQIAHNRVINHWVAEARRSGQLPLEASEEDADDDRATASDLAADEDLAAMIERRMRIAELVAEAARLTEAQQTVLGLRFAAGLSLRETAEVIGGSEDAVKQLQHRALARLRARLVRSEPDTRGGRVDHDEVRP